MDYLPIMLNLSGRTVVIIGGGEAAFKKARNVLPHCGAITVVASRFSSKMDKLPVKKVRMKIDSIFQLDGFLQDGSIVIIATDDISLNDRLERECRKRGMLFNRVDRGDSPFIFPASFDIDGVVISVSTRGRSPSLSRYLSKLLQKDVRDYAVALPVLEKLRARVKLSTPGDRADYFNGLLSDQDFWALIGSGRTEDAFEHGLRLSVAKRKQVKGKARVSLQKEGESRD